jgi:hypothetical protein
MIAPEMAENIWPAEGVHTEGLFAVPVHVVRLSDARELNRRLIDEFLGSRPEHQFSHPGGGRDENTIVQLHLVPTTDVVLRTAEKIGSELVGAPLLVNRDPEDLGFWFNAMEGQGIETLVHNHAGAAVLSGVYYVKVPPGSGSLRFTKERSHYFEPSLRHWVNEGRFFEDHLLDPEEGMMVLFPSFQDHAVTANESTDLRLSIAFNLGAVE